MTEVKQNSNTFDVYLDGQKAGFMDYEIKDGNMVITHTEVDEKFGGHGLGKKLVEAAVDAAKKDDRKIVSYCPFAKKVIEGTPEFKEVLAN